jgi:hypothetical protein
VVFDCSCKYCNIFQHFLLHQSHLCFNSLKQSSKVS